MEGNKIKVAITQGDINGGGLELILKTFAVPEMLELCTPIIYGSPAAAQFYKNKLAINTPLRIIKHAKEACYEHVNLLAIDEKTKLAEQEIAADDAAQNAIDRAVKDYEDRQIDVLVNMPTSKNVFATSPTQATTMTQYIAQKIGSEKEPLLIDVNEKLCITAVKAIGENSTQEIKQQIVQKAMLMRDTMRRYFRVSIPRMAILTSDTAAEEEEPGTMQREVVAAVKELSEKGVAAFGPYHPDAFFDNQEYEAFDALIAVDSERSFQLFNQLSDESMQFVANLPLEITGIGNSENTQKEMQNVDAESAFRHAIFLAIDAHRNNIAYQQPYANPLKKLYHEKRDESDKVRFSVSKRKSENAEEKKDTANKE